VRVGLVVPGFSADDEDWCIPVLVDAAKELARRVDLDIFTLRYPPHRAGYRVFRAQVHAFGGPASGGVGRFPLLSRAIAAIVREHRARPFAALHGVWADEPGFVATSAARLLSIPAGVSIMGGELVGIENIGYGGRLSRLNRLLTVGALRQARVVTAASEANLARARDLLPSRLTGKVRRLVWGADPDLFRPATAHSRRSPELRLLHVGSLVPVKDQATLISAAALVRARGIPMRLAIAGDGPLRGRLELQSRALGLTGVVTFHGQLARPRLAALYRESDALVVSSMHEGQSLAAVEAALCGVALVGTRVGLLADLAPSAAVAVPVGDAEALAGALTGVAGHDRRRSLAAAASEIAARDFTADTSAQRLLAMLGVTGARTGRVVMPALEAPDAAEVRGYEMSQARAVAPRQGGGFRD